MKNLKIFHNIEKTLQKNHVKSVINLDKFKACKQFKKYKKYKKAFLFPYNEEIEKATFYKVTKTLVNNRDLRHFINL